MQFIKSALLPNEKLIDSTRPHWIIFGPGVTLLVFALLILFIGPYYEAARVAITPWPLYKIIGALFTLLGLYWLIGALITYNTAEYGITDKRVIMKAGLIRRDTAEIFLDKIEAINVDQSMLGRFLDYGTLVIIGTGGTQDVYYNVPQPFYFRRAAQTQVDTEMHKRQ